VNQQTGKIYFVSDCHFGIPDYHSSLEREKKFVQWLDMIRADASEIFILGDLFDFWFEYRTVVPRDMSGCWENSPKSAMLAFL
jgi:UDP-2,3-diacylglucosamine hydrolase